MTKIKTLLNTSFYILDNGCNDGGVSSCLHKGICLRNGSCSCRLQYNGINCSFKRTGFKNLRFLMKENFYKL